MSESSPSTAAFASHPRGWRENRYVYPVCSRRSGGISIGINLNPDQVCNFGCVYCQIDRSARPAGGKGPVDLVVLRAELTDMLDSVTTGRLLAEPEFAALPDPLRRLNDIAFSGDGEATSCPLFAEAVQLADEANVAAGGRAKLVLITNATLFDRPAVQRGLDLLHRHEGEIWAKLDAGTEELHQQLHRSKVSLARIMDNLTWAARRWPIVIQSCFMRLAGEGPQPADLDAYCTRLADLIAAGGAIKLVQVYTVARRPAEPFVAPLPADEVDRIVRLIAVRFPRLAVKPFYGPK